MTLTAASVSVDPRLVDLVATATAGRVSPLIVGIAGPAGSGKSTLASALTGVLAIRGVSSIVFPLDGFHLSNLQLKRQRLSHCKGSPSSIDSHGFLSSLQRVRAGNRVYVPDYSRILHEAVAASIFIEPETDVIVVEGLYLLLRDEPWNHVKPLLDVSTFLDVQWEECRARLVARHHAGGRTLDDARAFVDGSDRSNSTLVLQDSDTAGTLFIRDGLLS